MNYPRNAWYVGAWTQDLPEATPLAVTILDEPIVLWRVDGHVSALADRCVHRLAPLSAGRCEGKRLRCMYHGLLYDPDGRVVEIPGQAQIPKQAFVRRYAAVVRHSWVWVWMGDPAQADESLIPPAIGFDDPDWILGRGFLDYEAEASLINDNLLDFSHLTYVHANSFGVGASFAEEHPRLTALPRGVRFERWNVDTKGSVGRGEEDGVLFDRWMSYDFLVPGVLLMWSGNFATGTARACNFQKPDYSQATRGVTFTSQAVTPTRPRGARYFFSWGPHRMHGDEALRDTLMRLADMAFMEDKLMIEAQQKVIDRTPSPKIMPTSHDRGVTMFSQLVARMVREEQGQHSIRPLAESPQTSSV